MRDKSILGICVMLAFLVMPLALLMNPILNKNTEPEFVGYRAEFIGQDKAEVGELVRFLAEGQIVRWTCLPESPDSESYGEFNENFVISFRKPGVYTVVAGIYVDGDLSIRSQEIIIEGPPTPDPIVVDLIVPQRIDETLVSRVEGWAKKYKVKKNLCINLAQNFESVVSSIDAGELVTPGQVINKTAQLNSGLKLSDGLMAELQAYLTSQSDVGSLRTMDQHVVVWKSIAAGLRKAVQ